MTDMTAVSAVSDTPTEDRPTPIVPKRTISARFLARNLAAILRDVSDQGDSFAIEHFGRVVGFLVPRDGRELVRRKGKDCYEVPEPVRLRDLAPNDAAALLVIGRHGGRAVMDEVLKELGGFGEAAMALAHLEIGGLALKTWSGYILTEEGRRHYEALEEAG